MNDPQIGRVVAGKYVVESRLAAGGMGALFLARQRHGSADLGQVVVKFLLAELQSDPDRRERFLREARAARELRSPHVVKIFDFGEDQGAPFLVMEYLPGKSLFHVLAEAHLLPAWRVLRIGRQVAEAMIECHERGILHRDLKPDNLLLTTSLSGDFVKIVDFGIAKVQGGGPARGQVQSLVIGTPRYMAPEQIEGGVIDHRIDIFALGVILFEALCGQPPIALRRGDNEMAYVALNVSEPPRRASELLLGVPPEFDALLDRMMAKSPDDRPANMLEVLSALEVLSGLPACQPPREGGAGPSGAHLLVPRPPSTPKVQPVAPPAGWRRYLVPALLGVVVGLLSLVLWLIEREAAQRRGQAPSPVQAPRVDHDTAGPEGEPDPLGADPTPMEALQAPMPPPDHLAPPPLPTLSPAPGAQGNAAPAQQDEEPIPTSQRKQRRRRSER